MNSVVSETSEIVKKIMSVYIFPKRSPVSLLYLLRAFVTQINVRIKGQ